MPGIGQLIRKYSWTQKEKTSPADQDTQRRNFAPQNLKQISTLPKGKGFKPKQTTASHKRRVCESVESFFPERGREGGEVARTEVRAPKCEGCFGVLPEVRIERDKKNQIVDANPEYKINFLMDKNRFFLVHFRFIFYLNFVKLLSNRNLPLFYKN